MKTAKIFFLQMCFALLLIAPSAAFVSEGAINAYLAYSDMEIKTPFVHRVKAPLLRGYFVNRTRSQVKATVQLSFYNIFHEQMESVTLYPDIPPAGRVEFRKYLSDRENIERLVRAYRIEWEVLSLSVDGKNMTEQ